MQWVKKILKGKEKYRFDGLWSEDLRKHTFGDLSYAVAQGDMDKHDFSQVEIGVNATYAGIYDGHGGSFASAYVYHHLFSRIIRLSLRGLHMFTPQTFLDAFSQIEDEFVQLVRTTNEGDHSMFEVGTSCLVCMLWGDDLFVCSLGDSRAVIGRKVKLGRFKSKAITIPLTKEDNVNIENVRQEIQHQNPNEEDVVIPDGNGVWRIRGLSEVSGSIGDLYLKFPEFATDRLEGRPINKALLKSIPTVKRLHIEEDDMFVIMGSRGFWDHISSEKAVEIVHNNSHSGIAKILIGEALNVAANKLAEKITSTAMVGENEGSLPMYDDISVVVIFIDQRLFHRRGNTKEFVSLKAYQEIKESEYNKTYRVEWKAPNPGIIVATSPPSTGVATSFRGAASGSGGGGASN